MLLGFSFWIFMSIYQGRYTYSNGMYFVVWCYMVTQKIGNSCSLLVKFNFKIYNSIFAYAYLIPFNRYINLFYLSKQSLSSDIFNHPLNRSTRFYNNRFTLITSVIITAIPTARQSKTNWMNTRLKHSSR